MDLVSQQLTELCRTVNDENNNLKNLRCSSCEDEHLSSNETEFVSIDTQRLWNDIAHLVKCVYRESNSDYLGNHSSEERQRVQEYVQILTQSNCQTLFDQLESLVLEYVNEIRDQVLQRFQHCSRNSHDIQLFISFLLDEYQAFVQAAQNVSTLVSYLEENYLKSFQLTWLLHNKHLYEKLVYMDKNIHQSLSILIDLLQPSNDDEEGNFNDYSPAQYTQLLNRFLAFDEEMSEIACLYKDCSKKMIAMAKNRLPLGIVVQAKPKEKSRSPSVSTPVDIPPPLVQQEAIPPPMPVVDPPAKPPGNDRCEGSSKKSKSSKSSSSSSRKEKPPLASELLLPRKPPSSSVSKFQPDFRPLTIPLLSNNETSSCPPFLSAKIQSVSFTAGTFGSITNTEPPSTSNARLNVNLRRKPVSAMTDLEHLLRQAKSPSEISAILSSFEPPVSSNTSFADPDDDFCSRCQGLTSDDESSLARTCANCTPLATSLAAGGFTSRGLEMKERLRLKFTKRAEQTPVEPKVKSKPSDNNIDDLVRFIDGQDTSPAKPASTSKKNKKKKGKGNPQPQEKIEPVKSKDSTCDTPVGPVKLEETPSIPIASSRSSTQSNFDSPSESFSPSEEEVNWITISRKQTKAKVSLPPTTHSEQKRQAKPAKKASVSQPPVPLLPPTVNAQTRISQQKQTTTVPARPTPSAWATVTSHEPAPEKAISTLTATAPAFIPSSAFSNDTSSAASSLSPDETSSSLYWNPSSSHGLHLAPGPVQRPTSRCIQRPSSEPRTSPFPLAQSIDQPSAIWNDTSSSNSSESLWQYSEDAPLSTLDDFPLYNPFKSGADRTLLTNVFRPDEQHYGNFTLSKDQSRLRSSVTDDLQDPWENLQFSDEQSFLR